MTAGDACAVVLVLSSDDGELAPFDVGALVVPALAVSPLLLLDARNVLMSCNKSPPPDPDTASDIA